MRVQVALDVGQLQQRRQLVLAGGLQLAAVLAQLGRHVGHAQQLVDLLLGRARVGGLGLVHRHAVLADVDAPAHGGGAQRLVVASGAGEVLEQVAELVLGHDPQVHRDVLHRGGARAGGARAAGLLDLLERLERLDQRGGVLGAGHDVQVLAALGPAAGAAGQLHADRGRVLAQRGRPCPRRPPAPSRAACAASPRRRPRRPARPARSPRPCRRTPPPCAAARPRRRPARSSRPEIPSWSCSSLARLGPRPGMRVTWTSPGGIRSRSFTRGRDVALGQQRVDLLGDRLAHPRQVGRPALRGQLGYRLAGVADGLGRVAVGQDAVDDRAVQLVERAQLVEGGGDLGVPHRHGGTRRVRAHVRRLAGAAHIQRGREPRERRARGAPPPGHHGAGASRAGRGRQLPRWHGPDRRPAGRGDRRRRGAAPHHQGRHRAGVRGRLRRAPWSAAPTC